MARSGQIAVTTAGTAVRGPDEVARGVALAAHPDNTDTVWVGDDAAGDVSSANGFPLPAAGEPLILRVNNLSELWFDADVNGEKVCWFKLD